MAGLPATIWPPPAGGGVPGLLSLPVERPTINGSGSFIGDGVATKFMFDHDPIEGTVNVSDSEGATYTVVSIVGRLVTLSSAPPAPPEWMEPGQPNVYASYKYLGDADTRALRVGPSQPGSYASLAGKNTPDLPDWYYPELLVVDPDCAEWPESFHGGIVARGQVRVSDYYNQDPRTTLGNGMVSTDHLTLQQNPFGGAPRINVGGNLLTCNSYMKSIPNGESQHLDVNSIGFAPTYCGTVQVAIHGIGVALFAFRGVNADTPEKVFGPPEIVWGVPDTGQFGLHVSTVDNYSLAITNNMGGGRWWCLEVYSTNAWEAP